MKIFVSGHNGLLGSACVRRIGLKHEIVTFDGNLLDSSLFNTWLHWHKPDAIVHCAAKVGGVKSNRDYPVQFLSDNLKLQEAVIGQAHKEGINNLVFIGTSCLFPKGAPVPVSEESLLTGPFENSVQAYAIAKLAGYALCRAYSTQFGRNYMTVCPANLFGIKDSYNESSHVIPSLIRKAVLAKSKNENLIVWGDGKAVREFMFSDDCADAIGIVLEKWNKPELINLGTGVSTRISDIVYMICEELGFYGEIIWDISQPVGIQVKTFDISKLQSLGFKSQTNLLTAIKLTIKDYLVNGASYETRNSHRR